MFTNQAGLKVHNNDRGHVGTALRGEPNVGSDEGLRDAGGPPVGLRARRPHQQCVESARSRGPCPP
eukprot:5453417-Pyramimonas_sp.AAC.1